MPWRSLALAASLCGCFVTRAPSLPAIEPRVSPAIRIFLVVDPHQPQPGPRGSSFGGWWDSASFAAFLEWSGFKPWVVQSIAEVPPDQPFIENVTWKSPNGCQGMNPSEVLTLLTVGVIPGLTCQQEGRAFDFRRSRDAPILHIDTVNSRTVWVGWLVGPLAFFPEYGITGSSIDEDEYQRLAIRAALLDALNEPGTP